MPVSNTTTVNDAIITVVQPGKALTTFAAQSVLVTQDRDNSAVVDMKSENLNMIDLDANSMVRIASSSSPFKSVMSNLRLSSKPGVLGPKMLRGDLD